MVKDKRNGENERQTFSVPSWLFDLGKMAVAAAVAVGLMYVRVSSLEKDVADLNNKIGHLDSGGTARSEMIADSRARIGTIEIKESVLEKSITEALGRIEADVKESKMDIKELQKRPQK
jgi:hypothetical protein